jgi:serine/threonine protein kinase
MSTPTTSDELLTLLRKSGLLDEKILKSLDNEESDLPANPQECAEVLVRKRWLTSFQAKQLLLGKFRGLILASYKILQPIGKGGMGIVFLAEHMSLKRKVAIKVLDKSRSQDENTLKRFQREARAAAALDHPNIVRLHDISQGAGVHFLVMEYVEGSDLQSFMAKSGALHYMQAVQYIAQAASGLHHAHEKGFVHRDIKPSNLILSRDGTIKILDLGLARRFSNQDDNLTGILGEEDQVAGTVDFISPEQSLGKLVDERSDIYSLGATLYALITGHPPYRGTTAQKLAQVQLSDPPRLTKLKGIVPPVLSEVVAKMMAKNPIDRHQSAHDVMDALSPWLPAPTTGNIVQDPIPTTDIRNSSTVTPVPPKEPTPPEAKPFLQQKWFLGSAIGLISVVVGLVVILGFGKPTNDRNDSPNPPSTGTNNQDETWINKGNYHLARLDRLGTATTFRPLFGNTTERYDFPEWGELKINGIPFQMIEPRDTFSKNVILLRGVWGDQCKDAPDQVTIPVNRPVRAIHFLGGVAGWAWPAKPRSNDDDKEFLGKVATIIRLKYTDGTTEEHQWINGEHVADYIRRFDVPGSEFVFEGRTGHQVRYISVLPRKNLSIEELSIQTGEIPEIASMVFAITVETP